METPSAEEAPLAAEASRRLPWPLASVDLLLSGPCWQTTPTTRRPRLGAPMRVGSARLGVDSTLIAIVVRVRARTAPCAA
jgi:hypothetical protein